LDKSVVELGTGWHGADLILFYLLGARRIVTIDHHSHLKLPFILEHVKYLRDAEVYNLLVEKGLLIDRLAYLEKLAVSVATLNELLDGLNIQYEIVSSKNYKNLKFEKVDLFYSQSVLHRIPAFHLKDLFSNISKSMVEGGIVFNRTDQADINALGHADSELWALNYLKYSDFYFNNILSCRFNSQNRLRESDFLKIFINEGMQPIFIESYVLDSDLSRLRNMKLASRFSSRPLEDVAIRSSLMVCKKSGVQNDIECNRVIRKVSFGEVQH